MSSFKSSEIKHDVNFLTNRPVWSETVDKAEYVSGRIYLLIDKSLPRCVLGFQLDL